ncbi:MAG: hypothetical protein NT003_04980 [Candidatus Magasanikbacteria bacterium]|nr:hypothetical protein [Candidatus Magasanikbacteria bacterium]
MSQNERSESNQNVVEFDIEADLAAPARDGLQKLTSTRDTLQARLISAPDGARKTMQDTIIILNEKIKKQELLIAQFDHVPAMSADAVRARLGAASEKPSIILSPELKQKVHEENVRQINDEYDNQPRSRRSGLCEKKQRKVYCGAT